MLACLIDQLEVTQAAEGKELEEGSDTGHDDSVEPVPTSSLDALLDAALGHLCAPEAVGASAARSEFVLDLYFCLTLGQWLKLAHPNNQRQALQ